MNKQTVRSSILLFLSFTLLFGLSIPSGAALAAGACDHIGCSWTKIVTYTYTSYGEGGHKRTTLHQEFCNYCGELAFKQNFFDNFSHRFDGGVCLDCGYRQSGGGQPTPEPAAEPSVTPTDGVCDHTPARTLLSTRYVPSTETRHQVINRVRLACACGQVKQEKEEILTALHQPDAQGLCKCGYQTAPEAGRYTLSLQNAEYYTYAGQKMPFVSPGETRIVYVLDLLQPDASLDLTRLGLHLEAGDNCAVQGLAVTFNEAGTAEIRLVRNSDQETLATLSVGVSILLVEDKLFTYSDSLTAVVQLKDMEAVDWKGNSLYAAKDFVINDFEADGEVVRFEAYNAGTLVYAVVSYDENGNEIGRTYIEGFDATMGIVESGARTLASAGNLFIHPKSGNNQFTKKTNVSLPIVPGGSIQILQPDHDIDLLAVNIVEMILRTWDMAQSTGDALKGVDTSAALDVAEKLGKKEIYAIAKELLVRELSTPGAVLAPLEPAKAARKMLNSKDTAASFTNRLCGAIFEKAGQLGLGFAKETVGTLEDIALLALTGATGGVSAIASNVLNGAQVIAEMQEFESLRQDFEACLKGERLVRLSSIMIPHADYDPLAVRSYAVPKSAASVRSGPARTYDKIGAATPDDSFPILDEVPSEDNTRPWYKIQYNGGVGYISSGMVTVVAQ